MEYTVNCNEIGGENYVYFKSHGDKKGYYVGIDQVDITPDPLLYTSGYAIEASRAIGKWTPLTATSFCIRGKDGKLVVFLTLDFWAVSQGLLDIVACKVQKDHGIPIGRSQILLCATHTHTSSGNVASNNMYNRFASGEAGFNCEYFKLLAERLAEVISNSYQKLKSSKIVYRKDVIFDIATNRSLKSFRNNLDADKIIEENKRLHPNFVDVQDLAICPEIRVLSVERNDNTVGVMVFVPIHPIASGQISAIYNSDIFGVAQSILESKLECEVGFFQGASGDISPNTGTYDRYVTQKIGQKLADKISEMLDQEGRELNGNLNIKYRQVDIAGQQFRYSSSYYKLQDGSEEELATSDKSVTGFASVGGSTEDAPTILNALGWKEGVVASNKLDPEQGFKREVLDIADCCPTLAGMIREMVLYGVNIPSTTPLTTVLLDDVLFGTTPGEVTCTNQYRWKQRMTQKPEINDAIILGLVNEYMSYFTTNEEYKLQHYEGASTIYGQHSTTYLLHQLEDIYNSDGIKEDTWKFKYTDLGNKVKSPNNYKLDNYDKLTNMIIDGRIKIFSYKSEIKAGWPRAEIQTCTAGNWHTLNIDEVPQTTEKDSFLTIVKKKTGHYYFWDIIWLMPDKERIHSKDTRCIINGDEITVFDVNEHYKLDQVVPASKCSTALSVLSKCFCCFTGSQRGGTSNYDHQGDIANVRVACYNIQVLFSKFSQKKVDLLISALLQDDYDIICFQELFDDNVKVQMERKMRDVYPYFITKTNREKLLGLGEDSGLAIFSKYTILDTSFVTFKNAAAYDWLAEKGVMKSDILVKDRILSIYNTHLQSSPANPLKYSNVRNKQLNLLSSFVKESRVGDKHSFIVLGDFNIVGGNTEYNKLVKFMGEEVGVKDTHYQFYDEEKDSYWNKQIRLDYIWNDGTVSIKQYEIVDYNSAYGHLSDHFCITTTLDLS